MRYGVESWWIYFVWCPGISFYGIGMPFCGDPKSGITIFTQLISTRKRIASRWFWHAHTKITQTLPKEVFANERDESALSK
jgi:hypothetical protein